MKLTYKRLLILFSVALNLGFILVAMVMLHQNSIPFKERSMRKFTGIVKQLELPESQSQTALDSIRQFESTIGHLNKNLKHARNDILHLLSRKGPLEPKQLHQLIETTDRLGKLKSKTFETHAVALRQLLGDEKGAQFFSLLGQHVKSEGKGRH